MCVRLQDVHSESAVSAYIYVLAVLAIHETDKYKVMLEERERYILQRII